MHPTHQKYRPDIDGLRALAVLSVIGFHAFPSIVKGGFVGVDVFFVISGFLISGIIFSNLENESFSYADFYARRIRRIFPALLLVFLACLAFGWFAMPPGEYKQLGKHVASGAAFISNFALWNESGYFDTSAETKPLLHLWSLGIEEQFYIFWPLLLGIVWRRKWNFLALTLTIGIASFAANVLTIQANPIGAFYSPLTRFWELMIGGILAYLTLHKPHHLPQNPNWQSSIGLALFGIGVLILNKASLFPGWWALLPTCGAFLIISAGPEAIFNKYFLANRVLVWVGLISYPLYLWHWPLLYVVNYYHALSPVGSHLMFEALKVGAVLVCFLFSYLTYRYFELVVRFQKGATTVWLLVFGLAMLGVMGVLLVVSNGFDWRYPRQIREVLSFHFDMNAAYRSESCFLENTQDKSKFAQCTTTPASDKGKTLLLWGDSHAAHLYPGLNAIAGGSAGIIQLNTNSCPPILGRAVFEDSPHCESNNNFVAEKINAVKPHMVILSGGWVRYDYWRELTATINFLKATGIEEIVLIGPVPRWKDSLPRQIFENYKRTGSADIPARLTTGLTGTILPLDAEMEAFAHEQGIKYLSPYKTLCNQQGCLTRTGTAIDSLTAFDYDHLTTTGSTYVVGRFPGWFFRSIGLEQVAQVQESK